MLDCPINLELYRYEIGDKIIALDVQSSKFLTIDNLSSKILDLADTYLTKDIISILSQEYPTREVIEKLNWLEELWEQEKINPYNRVVEGFEQFDHYELKLHPTSRCNLNCRYCFGGEVHQEKIKDTTIETAKEAIYFLVNDFGKEGSSYSVDLSGSGESLLRFDFIKEIKDYCEELSEKINKRILITLCTNGTLLDKEKSSYLKKNEILYGISIDGDEVINDDLRIYKDGRGTFKDIVKNCEEIEDREFLGFAVTLTGKHTNIKDIFLKLFQLNLVDSIGIKPIRLRPDNEYAMNEDNLEQIKEGYNEFALFLIEEIAKGNTEYLYAILRSADYFGKLLKRTIRNDSVIYRCSAGLNSLSVNHKGEIYSCPVQLNNSSFKMGSIYTGVDREVQEDLRQLYADNIPYCQGCWARYLCSGECFAVGEMVHQQKERPYRVMCEYKKHLIRLSIYLWTEIQEINPGIFDSIYRECMKMEW